MIKTPNKLDIERMYLDIIKNIYGKCTNSIILNRQKFKIFSLKIGEEMISYLVTFISNGSCLNVKWWPFSKAHVESLVLTWWHCYGLIGL
jgi:hypothetical protein